MRAEAMAATAPRAEARAAPSPSPSIPPETASWPRRSSRISRPPIPNGRAWPPSSLSALRKPSSASVPSPAIQGDIWWGGTRQQLSQGAADGVLAPAPQEVIDAIPEDYRDPEG